MSKDLSLYYRMLKYMLNHVGCVYFYFKNIKFSVFLQDEVCHTLFIVYSVAVINKIYGNVFWLL